MLATERSDDNAPCPPQLGKKTTALSGFSSQVSWAGFRSDKTPTSRTHWPAAGLAMPAFLQRPFREENPVRRVKGPLRWLYERHKRRSCEPFPCHLRAHPDHS